MYAQNAVFVGMCSAVLERKLGPGKYIRNKGKSRYVRLRAFFSRTCMASHPYMAKGVHGALGDEILPFCRREH